MAREDFSDRGLPSAEARRKILERAGIILNEARDLLALLDRYEAACQRSLRENQQVLERMAAAQCIIPINALPASIQAPTLCRASDEKLAA